MTKYQPLKIYLDSCDYGHLYLDRNEWQEDLVLYLKDKIASGEIVVVFSYPIVMEILQDFTPEYKEDRLSRAKFIKDICGNHCFRFFMDYTDGNDPYSDAGDWIPNYAKNMMNIDVVSSAMVSVITAAIKCNPLIPMDMKNFLDTPDGFRTFVAAYPDVFCIEQSKFSFSDECHEKEVIKNYILGRISKDEANLILQDVFKDPVLFFTNYFDVGEFRNHFTVPIHNASVGIQNGIDELRSISEGSELAKQIVEDYDITAHWERLRELIPSEIQWIFKAYFADNLKQPYYQKSDVADMLHGLYLPHCDLWRGDRRFSALLDRQKVPYRQKIVPLLSGLKNRIEVMLNNRNKKR